MSASRTTTNPDDMLDNPHPGAILREDFLVGSEIPLADVAVSTGLSMEALAALIAERIAVDAEIDLRLARYFGVSEGLFIGLQNDFDLEEVRRTKGPDLDRIKPYAA
jgi:antitoxin HigA-1